MVTTSLKRNIKRAEALERRKASTEFRKLTRNIQHELKTFTKIGFRYFVLILKNEKVYDQKSTKMVETGYAIFSLQLGAQSSVTKEWKIPVYLIEKYDKDCCKAIESLGFHESEVSPYGDYSVQFVLDL